MSVGWRLLSQSSFHAVCCASGVKTVGTGKKGDSPARPHTPMTARVGRLGAALSGGCTCLLAKVGHGHRCRLQLRQVRRPTNCVPGVTLTLASVNFRVENK